MRRLTRRNVLIAVACGVACLGGAALYVARPASAEFRATSHDAPTRTFEARAALAWARVTLHSYDDYEDASVAGVIPLYEALSEPASRGSVFAATRERGGDYVVAFLRSGEVAGGVSWHADELGLDEMGGLFSYDVDEAEQLLAAALKHRPEAIRYVDTDSYGFWVVARYGRRERGVFVHYQGGPYECWPGWGRVYTGAAVLRHLQHVEDRHRQYGSECTKPSEDWE